MMRRGFPNVSRETSEKLHLLVDLVRKWSPRINLVSKGDLQNLADRHIHDSLQLWELRNEGATWLDIGSGGGFPVLPLAIVASEKDPALRFTCIESDLRKCTFLRTAAREIGVPITVISERIEDVAPLATDTISARALADLNTLFGFAERHLSPDGLAIFPKGENWSKEVEQAQKYWSFTYETHTSITSSNAKILTCKGIARV